MIENRKTRYSPIAWADELWRDNKRNLTACEGIVAVHAMAEALQVDSLYYPTWFWAVQGRLHFLATGGRTPTRKTKKA